MRKYHKSLHSIVSVGFGLQESLSDRTYTLLLLIEVRYLYLSLPLLIHVVFTHTVKYCLVGAKIVKSQCHCHLAWP